MRNRFKEFTGAFALGFVIFLIVGITHGPVASAVVGQVRVQNESSTTMRIACNYDGPLISLSPGQNSQQSGKCDSRYNYDTDQIVVATTSCMKYTGPGYTDGWYKVQPNVRLKISDLTAIGIFNLNYGSPDKCAGRPYYNRR